MPDMLAGSRPSSTLKNQRWLNNSKDFQSTQFLDLNHNVLRMDFGLALLKGFPFAQLILK